MLCISPAPHSDQVVHEGHDQCVCVWMCERGLQKHWNTANSDSDILPAFHYSCNVSIATDMKNYETSGEGPYFSSSLLMLPVCPCCKKKRKKGWYCEVIFTGSTAAVRWACAYLLRGQSEEVLKIRPKSFLMHQQQPKHKHLRIKHCHTQADLLEQHLQLYSNNIGREELLFWSGT